MIVTQCTEQSIILLYWLRTSNANGILQPSINDMFNGALAGVGL